MPSTTPGPVAQNEGWVFTSTTALDQVALVRDLAFANSVLDDRSREYALNLMENIEPAETWGDERAAGRLHGGLQERLVSAH